MTDQLRTTTINVLLALIVLGTAWGYVADTPDRKVVDVHVTMTSTEYAAALERARLQGEADMRRRVRACNIERYVYAGIADQAGENVMDDGNEQQYQAEVMDEFESEVWWHAQDALSASREAAGQCPKCGSEMETNHTECMNIETFVRVCMECDYQGAPE
jgi:hypothetical protein